jgi:hypothetical protein
LGTEIGPYEVLAPIGAGGMGEVYRARDPRLRRDVAIKVLPAALAADTDRLRRFEQEARAAGALNHPNILAIYDLGTHEGVPYIISELLEGNTLRARITDAPIPARKAIEYALQIANALAAAHEKGIVHRDLKPENVFITHDGRVKLLDFGLAKLTGPRGLEREQAGEATRSHDTKPGVLLGTVGYMSPEEVRGMPVDHRSDLFALGTILYEMLSGVRPFQGDSAVETMNAILKEEPPDLSSVNPSVPPALERIVHHCLDKNPDERLQSARDLAFDLLTLSGLSEPGGRAPSLAASGGKQAGRVFLILGVAAALMATNMATYLIGTQGGTPPQPRYKLLTFGRGTVWSARFTPDGHTILYGAAWGNDSVRVFSRRRESPESQAIPLPSADVLAVSSSGDLVLSLGRRSTGGWIARGALAIAPIGGGAPRLVRETAYGADWGPGSMGLMVSMRDKLEYPAGKVLYKNSGYVGNPRVSPDGTRVAFIDHPSLEDSKGSITIADTAGKVTSISSGWNEVEGLAWRPDGKEIWFTAAKTGEAQALYAATLSGKTRLLIRAPVSLRIHDISREGSVLLTRDALRQGVKAGASGDPKERDLSILDQSTATDFNGGSVLITESGEGGGPEYSVYVRRTSGSPAVKLGSGLGLSLSPNGLEVLTSSAEAPSCLTIVPVGAGSPRLLSFEKLNVQNAYWLPGGEQFLMAADEPGHDVRWYVCAVGSTQPRPITPEGVFTGSIAISPDGSSIVAMDLARKKLVVYRTAGGASRDIPLADSLKVPTPIRWTTDPNFIFVRPYGSPTRIDRLNVQTGKQELWHKLALPDEPGVIGMYSLLSADGRSYVYTYTQILSELYLVEGLR